MRVGLHDYRTDPLLPQKDGVNFAHENISQLLRTQFETDLEVEFHDFNCLMNDTEIAQEVLSDLDCVVSNIGPHAHFYFWLRDLLGLDFRIVRDVRTAIWSSYLFQEHLAAPFLRADDTLIVASHYVWGAYEHMYPHLTGRPAALCYPLSVAFPQRRPEPRQIWPMHEGTVAIGYLGRLSEDKNFSEVVELAIRLNRESPDGLRYRLIACGDIHSPNCAPDLVAGQFEGALGPGDWFEYLPACQPDEIWRLFERFDVMVFSSTSNLETFGRVLVEASYARVPVVSGLHAAGPELVDNSGLCEVEYERGRPFTAHFDHSLGRVDVAAMAAAIASGKLRASTSFERYADHPRVFIDLLRKPAPPAGRPVLSPSQAAFIGALDVDLPALPTLDEAREILPLLAEWFRDLQRKDTPEYAAKIAHLRAISRYPERTERFIARSAAGTGDFTNVGGIDIELCHLPRFYPQFVIRAE